MNGNAIMAGLTFGTGCYKRRFFAEIAFNVLGSLFLVGATVKLPTAGEFGAGITFGFKVPVFGASRAIVSWTAAATISAKVGLNTRGEAALGLNFLVLPSMGPPTGFSVSPKAAVLALPQTQEERQQELDSTMAQHETVEDQFYAGVGTMITHLSNLDLSDVMESGELMSAFQDGAAAFAEETATAENGASEEKAEVAFPFPEFKEAGMWANLQVNFCFSCIPEKLPWYCIYGHCW